MMPQIVEPQVPRDRARPRLHPACVAPGQYGVIVRARAARRPPAWTSGRLARELRNEPRLARAFRQRRFIRPETAAPARCPVRTPRSSDRSRTCRRPPRSGWPCAGAGPGSAQGPKGYTGAMVEPPPQPRAVLANGADVPSLDRAGNDRWYRARAASAHLSATRGKGCWLAAGRGDRVQSGYLSADRSRRDTELLRRCRRYTLARNPHPWTR